MAREKIEIKRIDKRSARQVTYSKRRKGLIKKAQELSILCDVEVALMVFSSTGKFTHFASTSLDQIIDKYLERQNNPSEEAQHSGDVIMEDKSVDKLNNEVHEAEALLRQMQGENLESLSFKELEKLEKSVANALDLVHKKREVNLIQENEKLRQHVNMLMAPKEELRLSFESVNNVSDLTYNEHEEIDTTLRLGFLAL